MPDEIRAERGPWRENLMFEVSEWAPKRHERIVVLARCGDLDAAHAAYDSAAQKFPDRWIMLLHWSRVMRQINRPE